MASQTKKVKFDPYNIVMRNDPTSESADVQVILPCDDGAVATIDINVQAPTRVPGESPAYEMKVTTVSEVKKPDRSLGEEGHRERSDGLSWEIPKNFPGATVALLDHEKKMKEFIMRHFKQGKTFVDVGANFGGYSVRAAAWEMKVFAFEPNPDNLQILRRNIELNKVSVEVFPYAIGASDRKARLTPNGGFSRVVPEGGIEVEMRTLDSFELPSADFLKIDVEGFELEVLKGAKKTLARHHPVVAIEMHYWLGAANEMELFQILKELGYRFEYVDRFGLGMHLAAYPA